MTLEQKLEEQKINCKCRNPRQVHDHFCPLFSPDEGMLEAGKLMSQAKDTEISLLKARSEDDKELFEGELCDAHKHILTLKQKLEEQKLNCKCRNPR